MTATVTTNTCKAAQTRPLLMNLPCDNTLQSVCLKKIPFTDLCRAPASARGITAMHRKPVQGPGLPPTSPNRTHVCQLPSSPAVLQARRNQAAPIQHHTKRMHLSRWRRRDFSHTHPRCAPEDVRALLQYKSAATRRGPGDPPFGGMSVLPCTFSPHTIALPFLKPFAWLLLFGGD